MVLLLMWGHIGIPSCSKGAGRRGRKKKKKKKKKKTMP
jgi:hypothetical protein